MSVDKDLMMTKKHTYWSLLDHRVYTFDELVEEYCNRSTKAHNNFMDTMRDNVEDILEDDPELTFRELVEYYITDAVLDILSGDDDFAVQVMGFVLED